jgi:hypothetical protein
MGERWQAGPPQWGLPCTKVGDASAFREGKGYFVLGKTHLSHGSCWNS